MVAKLTKEQRVHVHFTLRPEGWSALQYRPTGHLIELDRHFADGSRRSPYACRSHRQAILQYLPCHWIFSSEGIQIVRWYRCSLLVGWGLSPSRSPVKVERKEGGRREGGGEREGGEEGGGWREGGGERMGKG